MATYPLSPSLSQGVNGVTQVNDDNYNAFVDNINAIGDDLGAVRTFYSGKYNVSPDGDTATTGDMNSGTDQLTNIASVATWVAGMGIRVTAAGVASADLVTTVSSISGTTFTLADNAGTTQTGAAVYHDEDTGLQAAIDAAAAIDEGGVVELPMGKFRLVSDVDLKSKVSLRGQGESTVILSPTGTYPISAVGTADGAGDLLLSNADALQFDVILASGLGAGYSAGDWIRIYSDTAFDSDATQTISEIRLVESVASDTLTLTEPLFFAYTTADNAAVEKITMMENITVSNMRFEGGGDAQNQKALMFTFAYNVRIHDVSIIDFADRAIELYSCTNAKLNSLEIDNCQRAGLGYGVACLDSSRGLIVSDSNFSRCRHAVTFGGNTSGVQFGCIISNCVGIGGAVHNGQFDLSHHTHQNIIVKNCIVMGDHLGAIATPHNLIEGNVIVPTKDSTYGVVIWAECHHAVIRGNYFMISDRGIGIANADVADIVIQNNVFVEAPEAEATTYGILVENAVDDLLVDGNVFDGVDIGFAMIVHDRALADSHDITIRNNSFHDHASTVISIKAEEGQDIYNVAIRNNHIEVASGQIGIRCFDEANGVRKIDGLVVEGNYIHGAGNASIKIGNASTAITNCRVGKNTIIGATVQYDINAGVGLIGDVIRNVTEVSSSGTGEDNLMTYVLPAKAIPTTGAIRISASGRKTGGNGNKTVKLYFGTVALTFNVAANDTQDWVVSAIVFNDGSGAQKIQWVGHNGATAVSGYDAGAEDTTAAVTIKCTGECVDGGDAVIQETLLIENLI